MIRHVLTAVLFALTSQSASADLLGSQILLEHHFDNRIDATAVVTVENGPADTADMFLGINSDGRVGYRVDIDSGSISIDFYIQGFGTYFNSGAPLNGLVISGPSFQAEAFKQTALINQSYFYFSPNRISVIDTNSVGLDFQLLSFNDSSSLSISFSQASPVPEPETYAMMLAGLGLVGAATWRRKQSELQVC